MNYKYLIVGIFLIAMLTIGAASASDFAQNDEIAACSDNLSSVDDSANILGEGSYYDDDFSIYVQENYSYGKYDWDTASLIYINSYCQKNGTFTVSVNGVDKLDVPLTDGHFSVEEDENGTYNIYYKSISPNDLALDYGEYDVKVKFGQNTLIDNKVTLNEKEDFDIYLSNPYYCEEEYWNMPSFIVIDSNSVKNGTLEVFVNGNRKMSYSVVNGCFDWIADCSNRSRYLSPSDLLDGYGTYDIRVAFTEDGSTKVLKDESVLVAEFEPTVDPKLELGFYSYVQYLRNDNVAYIYLPREATGSLTISYNDEINKTVQYSKGFATYTIYAWTVNHLGETTFTATYVGDDFGTLTATETIVVAPTVNGPAYVSQGEEFSFSMITHEWVQGGKFDVYDYTGDVKGNLITSGAIYNGLSSVKLSSNKLGLNKYYLEFDTLGSGKYHSIQEVQVIKNSENITVDIPTRVIEGQEVNVKVNAPASPYTFAYISVDGRAAQYYSMENGTVSETLQGLSPGIHTVSVQYNNGYYEDGCWVGDVYSNTFTVTVMLKTTLTAGDVVTTYKNASGVLVATITDSYDEPLSVDLNVDFNGVSFTVKSDSNGQISIPIGVLTPKTYVATISYDGDDAHVASSATANVVVNRADTVISAQDVNLTYKDASGVLVATIKNVYGNSLSVNLNVNFNGENYTVRADSRGRISVPIGVLTPGSYAATISYAGNINYNPSSTTANVIVNKMDTVISAPDVSVAYKDAAAELAATVTNANGKALAVYVTVNLNGANYTVKANSKGQITVPTADLTPKTYTATITYNGNGNYNPTSTTAKVTVKKAGTVITAPDTSVAFKNTTNKTIATLTDAYGKGLAVYVNVTFNGEKFVVRANYWGQISVSTAKLTPGTYTATVSYKGNGNYKGSTATARITVTKADTVMTAPDTSVAYKNPADKTIATLTDAYGKGMAVYVNVTLNGEKFAVRANYWGEISVSTANLAPGTYAATVSYKGNGNYKGSTATSQITVTKADTVITAPDISVAYKDTNGKLVATLTNAYGKALGVYVTVNLNGVSYDVRADSKGQICISTADLAPGNYAATITYNGNGNYNPTSTTTQITVNKANTVITAPDVTVKSGDSNGKLVATLTNAYGKALSVYVTYNLNGVDYNVRADSKGQISIPTKNLAPGSYTTVITYQGNGNYNPTITTANIAVI